MMDSKISISVSLGALHEISVRPPLSVCHFFALMEPEDGTRFCATVGSKASHCYAKIRPFIIVEE
jgi:hypothetical protein